MESSGEFSVGVSANGLYRSSAMVLLPCLLLLVNIQIRLLYFVL